VPEVKKREVATHPKTSARVAKPMVQVSRESPRKERMAGMEVERRKRGFGGSLIYERDEDGIECHAQKNMPSTHLCRGTGHYS